MYPTNPCKHSPYTSSHVLGGSYTHSQTHQNFSYEGFSTVREANYLSIPLEENEKNYSQKSKGYIYSYTDALKWLRTPENELLRSEIGEQKLVLTNKRLYWTDEIKKYSFWLGELSAITIKFRRLMLPLVFGGIAGPLFMVAMLKGILVWWLGFSLSFFGFLLFAKGLQGRHQLEIQKGAEKLSIGLDSAPRYWEKIIDMAERQRALHLGTKT